MESLWNAGAPTPHPTPFPQETGRWPPSRVHTPCPSDGNPLRAFPQAWIPQSRILTRLGQQQQRPLKVGSLANTTLRSPRICLPRLRVSRAGNLERLPSRLHRSSSSPLGREPAAPVQTRPRIHGDLLQARVPWHQGPAPGTPPPISRGPPGGTQSWRQSMLFRGSWMPRLAIPGVPLPSVRRSPPSRRNRPGTSAPGWRGAKLLARHANHPLSLWLEGPIPPERSSLPLSDDSG